VLVGRRDSRRVRFRVGVVPTLQCQLDDVNICRRLAPGGEDATGPAGQLNDELLSNVIDPDMYGNTPP
jgi:hypothetical protein